MSEIKIRELLTESDQEERDEFFIQKNEYLYQYADVLGNKREEFILINVAQIRDDTTWMNRQDSGRIDLETACAYREYLEKWYCEVLVQMKEADERISRFCIVKRKEEKPQYNPKDGETEEEKEQKRAFRLKYHNTYRNQIMIDIAAELREETEYIESYLLGKKLDVMKKKENAANGFIEKFLAVVEKVLKEHWDALKTNEEQYISTLKGNTDKNELEKQKEVFREREWIKKQARQESCEQIFGYRKWNVETWLELLFLKFYQKVDRHKPVNGRKNWIEEETKKWFVIEEKNKNVWQFTKEAVMQLTELEDEEQRLDLVNYKISPNISLYDEIQGKISATGIKKDYLEKKAGVSEKGIIKRLKQNVKVMEPFTACVLWKECNLSFENMFQITALDIPNEEQFFRTVCQEVIGETKRKINEIAIPELYQKNGENNFWYTPMLEVTPVEINIELRSPEKITMTIEYATFFMKPLVIELPYSRAMKEIAALEPEKISEIAKKTGYETKEDILKYSAEMMARNYCRIFLGIPYEEFQKIKC